MADPTQMEWFQALQRLPAQFDALTWLDFTLLAVALIGLLAGNRKGFAVFFGHLVLLVITVTITHQFSETIAKSFPFESPVAQMLMSALTYASIAIVSFFLIGMALKLIGQVLQVKFADFFDRISGAVLGCLYFILLFSFISNFALIFPGEWLQKQYKEEALSGKFLIRFSTLVHDNVIQVVPPEWRGIKIKAQ